MRAVIVAAAVLLPLTACVGLVHGTRSAEFVIVVAGSALVLGWLLISLAFSRFDR